MLPLNYNDIKCLVIRDQNFLSARMPQKGNCSRKEKFGERPLNLLAQRSHKKPSLNQGCQIFIGA
jgi:hypothetical protein